MIEVLILLGLSHLYCIRVHNTNIIYQFGYYVFKNEVAVWEFVKHRISKIMQIVIYIVIVLCLSIAVACHVKLLQCKQLHIQLFVKFAEDKFCLFCYSVFHVLQSLSPTHVPKR